METVLQELIEKISDAQRKIIGESEYANGYDGALSDCINIAELLLEKEKDFAIEFALWVIEGNINQFIKEPKILIEKFINSNFGDNPEAGI